MQPAGPGQGSLDGCGRGGGDRPSLCCETETGQVWPGRGGQAGRAVVSGPRSFQVGGSSRSRVAPAAPPVAAIPRRRDARPPPNFGALFTTGPESYQLFSRKRTTLGMWYVRGQIGSVVQCTARCISSAPLLSPLRLRLPHPAQPPPPPARSSGDRARSPAAAGLHPVEHRELLLPLGHVAGGLVDGGRHLQDALLVLDRQRAEAHEREVAAKQLVVFRS